MLAMASQTSTVTMTRNGERMSSIRLQLANHRMCIANAIFTAEPKKWADRKTRGSNSLTPSLSRFFIPSSCDTSSSILYIRGR